MTGGLFDPLGTERGDTSPRPPLSVVLAGAALVALAGLLALSYWRDDGGRGRPVAVVPIIHVDAPPRPVAAPTVAAPSWPPGPASPVAAGSPGLPAAGIDQEVEVQNGVRIIRPRRSPPAAPGPPAIISPAPAPR